MATGTKRSRAAPRERIDLATALVRLEAAGTAQNRKGYRRHGAGDNLYGVSFANLRALAKVLRPNQALAGELWGTGNADARLLACMIADPDAIDDRVLDAWIGDVRYYVLVDVLVAEVAAKAPGPLARMRRWMASEGEWVAQGGWDLLAHHALQDGETDDDAFLPWIETVEREIHASQNRVRHAMNGALIAIGARSDRLAALASEAAARIGPVEVDHGETGCKTPDAAPYIARARAHRLAKERRRVPRARGAG